MLNEMNNFTADITIKHYDNQHDFNNNIEKINDSYIYIDEGNISVFSIFELIKINTTNNLNNIKKLLDYIGLEYNKNTVFYDILTSFSNLKDLIEILNNFEIKYKKHFEIIETTGYSQGDYAEVIIPIKKLKEAWGIKVNLEQLQKRIDNLFWDPITNINVVLNLNNSIYKYDNLDLGIPEYWNYPYNINTAKKDTINKIKKDFKYVAALDRIIKTVEDAFPTKITESF